MRSPLKYNRFEISNLDLVRDVANMLDFNMFHSVLSYYIQHHSTPNYRQKHPFEVRKNGTKERTFYLRQ